MSKAPIAAAEAQPLPVQDTSSSSNRVQQGIAISHNYVVRVQQGIAIFPMKFTMKSLGSPLPKILLQSFVCHVAPRVSCAGHRLLVRHILVFIFHVYSWVPHWSICFRFAFLQRSEAAAWLLAAGGVTAFSALTASAGTIFSTEASVSANGI